MTNPLRLTALTDAEFARLGAGTVMLVPVGSIEPHGPFPLGTDGLVAERVLERVAARAPRTCLFPCVPLGYLFKYAGRSGAIGVEASVVQQYAFDLCRGFAAARITRALFMSGHDENREPLLLGLQAAHAAFGTVSVYCDWLDLAVTLARQLSKSKREGHGSEIQAGVLRHLCPETPLAVEVAAATPASLPPPALGEDDLFAPAEGGTWVRAAATERTYTGEPARGTAEQGAKVVERIVARAVEIVEELQRSAVGDA